MLEGGHRGHDFFDVSLLELHVQSAGTKIGLAAARSIKEDTLNLVSFPNISGWLWRDSSHNAALCRENQIRLLEKHLSVFHSAR